MDSQPARFDNVDVAGELNVEGNLDITGELGISGGTATATSGAATLNEQSGKVTSESLTTAAGATYTLTLTNSKVAATSLVFANAYLGTASTGVPQVVKCTPAAGSVAIVVKNIDGAAALNGTIKIDFLVLN